MTTPQGISLVPGHAGWARRPRLVVIDVDHTLIRSDHTLADATVDAVHRIRAADVEVVLASSRPPGSMRQYLEPLGLVEPALFVGLQGAFVGAFDANGALRTQATFPLDHEIALAAATAGHEFGLATNWYTADGWFVDRVTDAEVRESQLARMQPRSVTDMGMLPAPLKLLFIGDHPEQIDLLRPLLPDSVTVEVSKATYFEVTASGVDKATGVEVVAAKAGIALTDTVAIGDGRNDLGMFRRAAGAIAPANADPAVRAEADYMTASNDDDEVAIALNWLAELPR